MLLQLALAAIAFAATLHTSNAQGCKQDVILVLDASGSIRNQFDKHTDYAKELVQGFDVSPEGQRVAIVLYNGIAKIKFDFEDFESSDDAVKGIESLPFLSGVTRTGKALIKTKELLKQRRSGVPLVVVIIHDGFSWDRAAGPASELREERDVFVYAVGLVDSLWKEELERLVAREDMVYYGMDSVSQLSTAIKRSCRAADPPTTPRPTTRRTRATTRRARTRATTRRTRATPRRTRATTTRRTTTLSTTTRPTTTTFGGCYLDILFVMDASGSVLETWEEELTLAAKIVDLLVLGERNAQVSMIKFAGPRKEKVIFQFGEMTDKEEMKSKILSTKYMSGTTDMAGALELASEQLKKDEEVRPGSQKVIMLFTDGYSFTDPVPVAEKIRNQNVVIYAIGIRKIDLNRRELELVTDDPEKIFTENELSQFEDEYRRITSTC